MTNRNPDAPEILFYPPYLSLLAPALAIVLEWLAPPGFLPGRFSASAAVAGTVLLILAGWLALAANRCFERARTNADPRRPALAVVRGGPYRFTRNPMYLGMILLQFGLALAFSLDWAIPLGLLLWAALHWGVVLREEAYLTEKFGDDYRALLTSTRRWF